jgi:hypothetical protein
LHEAIVVAQILRLDRSITPPYEGKLGIERVTCGDRGIGHLAGPPKNPPIYPEICPLAAGEFGYYSSIGEQPIDL